MISFLPALNLSSSVVSLRLSPPTRRHQDQQSTAVYATAVWGTWRPPQQHGQQHHQDPNTIQWRAVWGTVWHSTGGHGPLRKTFCRYLTLSGGDTGVNTVVPCVVDGVHPTDPPTQWCPGYYSSGPLSASLCHCHCYSSDIYQWRVGREGETCHLSQSERVSVPCTTHTEYRTAVWPCHYQSSYNDIMSVCTLWCLGHCSLCLWCVHISYNPMTDLNLSQMFAVSSTFSNEEQYSRNVVNASLGPHVIYVAARSSCTLLW